MPPPSLPNAEGSLVLDNFEQFLDDTAPTLLDFLNSLEVDGALGIDADVLSADEPQVGVKEAENIMKPKAKSNTWRQRQRLEVLRLQDKVKQLDAELKKMKLAVGVRSTLPVMENVSTIEGVHSKRPALKKLLSESWQNAASRESLARQVSDVENGRLHRVLRMQVKHARKLHRMVTQQMTTVVMAQALGYRPALCGEEGQPPTDNNAVFQKLLAELDRHRGNVSRMFMTDTSDQEFCFKKEGQVSINRARGLQVHIVDSYTVPFSVEATGRVIWNMLTGREGRGRKSGMVYNELFEVDGSTALQSVRTIVVTGVIELCFLIRSGCRKYVEGDLTYFVVNETSIVSTTFGAGVSYDKVVLRTVKHGGNRAGSPTAIIETRVLATFPSYKTLNCLPPEGLKGFHDSLMRFNHSVEDALVGSVTHRRHLKQARAPDKGQQSC